MQGWLQVPGRQIVERVLALSLPPACPQPAPSLAPGTSWCTEPSNSRCLIGADASPPSLPLLALVPGVGCGMQSALNKRLSDEGLARLACTWSRTHHIC